METKYINEEEARLFGKIEKWTEKVCLLTGAKKHVEVVIKNVPVRMNLCKHVTRNGKACKKNTTQLFCNNHRKLEMHKNEIIAAGFKFDNSKFKKALNDGLIERKKKKALGLPVLKPGRPKKKEPEPVIDEQKQKEPELEINTVKENSGDNII